MSLPEYSGHDHDNDDGDDGYDNGDSDCSHELWSRLNECAIIYASNYLYLRNAAIISDVDVEDFFLEIHEKYILLFSGQLEIDGVPMIYPGIGLEELRARKGLDTYLTKLSALYPEALVNFSAIYQAQHVLDRSLGNVDKYIDEYIDAIYQLTQIYWSCEKAVEDFAGQVLYYLDRQVMPNYKDEMINGLKEYLIWLEKVQMRATKDARN